MDIGIFPYVSIFCENLFLGDGTIDFVEFVSMIQRNKHKMNDEKLLKAFKVFDKDGNGLIDKV
jgi:Ca2+-binding EF-hand superfamily protein